MAKDLSYELTPHEYSMYQLLNAGIDPVTGKPFNGMTLKDATVGVLKKYKILGADISTIEPQQYLQATLELHNIFMNYRKIADARIRGFGNINQKLFEQAKQLQTFKGMRDVSQ